MIDDFIQGMIIIARVSDTVYGITKNEVYEINDVYESSLGDVSISFIGNNGGRINKNANMHQHGFDKYFEIA